MRIDGHLDCAVGQKFHVTDKVALLHGMYAVLEFLTWDTSLPFVPTLQKKGWEKVQSEIDKIELDPSWSRGMDIETDANGKLIMEFFDEWAFLLDVEGFPIKTEKVFRFIALLFHNDEMYREKMGWAVEWFANIAWTNPYENGVMKKIAPHIRPDLVPDWFIHDRISMWSDEDYLDIVKRCRSLWDKYDLRQNRKGHIGTVFDVFVRLFTKNEAFRTSTKEMVMWLKNKPWIHEEWFDPMVWYPRTRGGIHYGVHGGSM